MTFTSHVIVLLAKLFSGFTVRWVDCQPDTCQRIYFANHTSHLDAVVLWSALPRELRRITRPVAAKDYWSKGWLKPHMAESFNALLVDRKEIKVHKSPIDIMLQQMGDVYSLIMLRVIIGHVQHVPMIIYHYYHTVRYVVQTSQTQSRLMINKL